MAIPPVPDPCSHDQTLANSDDAAPNPARVTAPARIRATLTALASVAAVAAVSGALGLGAPILASGLCAVSVSGWWWRRSVDAGVDSSGDSSADSMVVAVLVGGATTIGLVPHAAFCLAVVSGQPMVHWQLVTLDLAVAATAWLSARRYPPPQTPTWPTLSARWPTVSARWPLWLAAGGFGLLYGLRHGGALSPWACVQQAASVAMGRTASDVDLVRGNVGDAQLGNAGLIAGAWLRGLDMAHLHALTGAALALAGWRLGTMVSPNQPAGWAGLVVLAANPLVLVAPLADENSFTLAMLSVALTVAQQPRPAWLWLGALVGFAFTVRHPLAVAVPAFALLARQQAGWRRGVLPLLAAPLLASAVEHAHHLLAFGSLLAFETHAQVPPQTYSVGGWSLVARGLMNWPLHAELVRTPHNPWPMWLQWPLHALAHLGIVVAAMLLVGAAQLWLRQRTQALFWLLFAVPLALGLGIQEGWDYPNKMGVGLVLLPVLAPLAAAATVPLWTGQGQRTSFARWWPWLAALAAMTLVGTLAASHRQWSPADPRYGHARSTPVLEWPAWLAAERARLTPDLWPRFSALWRHGQPFAALSHPVSELPVAWNWFADELAAAGPPTDWRLDLSADVFSADPTSLAQVATGVAAADLDLTTSGTQHVAHLETGWNPGGVTLWAMADKRLGVVRIDHGQLAAVIGNLPRLAADRCRSFDTLLSGAATTACASFRPIAVLPAVLRVRTPAPRLSMVVAVNDSSNLLVLWRFERLSSGAVRAQGPVVFWHN